jgi:hypothetical protein
VSRRRSPLKNVLWEMPRRDMVHHVGRRMQRLADARAAAAWRFAGRELERMGDEVDVPKFMHLITTLRAATIGARTLAEREGLKILDSVTAWNERTQDETDDMRGRPAARGAGRRQAGR